MSNLAKHILRISFVFNNKTRALICVARILYVTDHYGFIVEIIVVLKVVFL